MEALILDLKPCGSDRPLDVGRDHGNDLEIPDNSVSRRHASLTIHSDGKVEVRDTGSTHGTYVNNARVQVSLLKNGDIVRFGNSCPFRFDSMQLTASPELVGMSLRFEGVSLVLGERTILRHVSAEIRPDEFVGIIGPSGSGKSTLLASLTGVYEHLGGRIFYDGDKELQSNQYLLEKIGVVPQKDLIFEELTVRENLVFSGQIKKPKAGSAELDGLVADALEAVGMTEHATKQVSALSGGQRKRVNVAIELLQRPRLLLLDEPTSGLDPVMEARLFDKLKSLSRHGMTVICVAHTKDFRFFDKLICLRVPGDGDASSIAFAGDPEEYEKLGLASAKPGNGSTGGLAARTGSRHPPLPKLRDGADPEHFLPQAMTILRRTVTCLGRDHHSVYLSLALPLTVAALIVFSQKEQSSPGHICFFMIITAFWLGMTAGVREIVKEQKLYIRDKLSGLAPGAYFIGKSCYAALLATAQAALLFLSVAIFFGVTKVATQAGGLQQVSEKLGFVSVVASFIPLIVAAVGGALAGIMVSTFTRTERAAVATLPLILLPQILLSRIAYGEIGGSPLAEPPFGSVMSVPGDGLLDGLLYFVSLGFITRPCATAMTMCFGGGGRVDGWPTMVAAEWIYMLIVVALYFLVAAIGFLRVEIKWRDWR